MAKFSKGKSNVAIIFTNIENKGLDFGRDPVCNEI